MLKTEHLGYSKMAGSENLIFSVEPLPLLADATGADEGIGRDDGGSETELAKGAEAGPECHERIIEFHLWNPM